MKKTGQKWICLLLAAGLMLLFSFAAAENVPALPDQLDEDQEAGTAAETVSPDAAGDLTQMFGEGEMMQIGLMTEIDTVGARYVFAGIRSMRRGLALLLRVSEKEVICWQMERTAENISKALQFFSPDAPMCCATLYEQKQLSKRALYIRNTEGQSYEAFLEDAGKVISSLPVSKPLAEASADDPLLKDYAGISWDMTVEQLKAQIGKRALIDSSSSMVYRKDTLLYGTVTCTFMLENDRAKQIVVMLGGDKAEEKISISFTGKYGKAMRSSYANALFGNPKEDPESDTQVWTSGDTLIILHDKTVIYLPTGQ